MPELATEQPIASKTCSKCGVEKALGEFNKHKNRKDGYQSYCKLCKKQWQEVHGEQRVIYNKRWGESHKEQRATYGKRRYETHKKKVAAINKQWKETHKEQYAASNKKYRETHKEQCAASIHRWQKANKEYLKFRQKERKLTDINFKMSCDIRSRMSKVARGDCKAGSAVRDCGCSMDFLRQYLESKFDSTMSWQNYGQYGWHIDHITPLSAFNLANREQFLTAVHYTNLQPLWWTENLSKGANF